MSCEYCGKPFEGRTARARFCSGSCRALASKLRRREGKPVGAVVVKLGREPVADSPDGALVGEVSKALADAKKSGWQVQHALELARKLSTPGEAGAASLSKELARVMGELLADVQVETDELDEMQGRVLEFRRRRSG